MKFPSEWMCLMDSLFCHDKLFLIMNKKANIVILNAYSKTKPTENITLSSIPPSIYWIQLQSPLRKKEKSCLFRNKTNLKYYTALNSATNLLYIASKPSQKSGQILTIQKQNKLNILYWVLLRYKFIVYISKPSENITQTLPLVQIKLKYIRK